MLLAAAVILGGVALITLANTRGPRQAAVAASDSDRDVAGPVQVRDGRGETTGVSSTAASG
jgi:hypothetical protein